MSSPRSPLNDDFASASQVSALIAAGIAAIPTRFLDGTFTVATLPTAADNTQKYAWVTDLHDGQPDYCLSDGTRWKPVRPLAVFDRASVTGALSLLPLRNSPTQRIKSMVGSATITMGTANAYSGAKFRVTKEPSGLLTATVVGLINTVLPGLGRSYADYEYSVGDGGWFVSASGGLL